jgi:hypothetical protein
MKFKKLLKIIEFKFEPNRYTLLAIILGIFSIGLSFLLNYSKNEIIWIISRDILQISIIGVIIPFVILSKQKDDFFKSGIRFDKPFRFIFISIVLGGLLLFQFISEDSDKLYRIGIHSIEPAICVMVINIFEIIFFYAILRFEFEKAFGIIISIVISSAFYSFHHAGFQPEFLKLFLVGLIFMIIYRIANHWLICFPLFWIGGTWDVLVKSDAVTDLSRLVWRRSIFFLIIYILIFIIIFRNKKGKNVLTTSDNTA